MIAKNSCADLSLKETVSNALPKVGDIIVYTITLTNEGPDSATGIEVTDYTISLSSSLEYVSHTATGSSTYNATTGIWNLSSETITTGNSVELAITVKIINAGQIINTVEITKNNQVDKDSSVGTNN